MAQLAIDRGAHVRVGLGDNPVDADGSRFTNTEMVQRIVEMAAARGRQPATPAEARAILGAPGN
jgi:uncharacterized protein (DUF849 family)